MTATVLSKLERTPSTTLQCVGISLVFAMDPVITTNVLVKTRQSFRGSQMIT